VQITKSKWYLPALSVVLGVVMLIAMGVGGDLTSGLISLGVMTGFGAVFVFGGLSETIRGLRGDGSDERFRQIDIQATAFAGIVVITAIIIAFLVEVARGNSGAPFTWLGAIAGLAYLLALVGFRIRG
jgi:hypothetical protein